MAAQPLPAQAAPTCKTIRKNIEAIVKFEEQLRNRRKPSERIADAVGGFSGSMPFVLLHVAGFAIYFLINANAIPGVRAFDPYPYLFLTLALSVEAIFLSTFVLMKQNRDSKRADQRAHLDLQINLLAEQEMTLVLQMLQRISTRLGARLASREIEDLSEQTCVETLASELEQHLPEE